MLSVDLMGASINRIQNSALLNEHLLLLIVCYIYAGGLSLSRKHEARIAEIMGRDLSIYANIYQTNKLAAYTIHKYGTDEQRDKYLPLLAAGKLKVAVAVQENAKLVSWSTLGSSGTHEQ